MTKFTYRYWQILFTFLSFAILASSFYFQYVKGLQPCPLCLMQRLSVFLLFALCFIGAYVGSLRAGKLVAVLQILIALCGLYFASRQLWLESLPANQTPTCMPGLDILLQYFPWQDIVRTLFWGTGECAHVSWQWLGLSMPAWTALYFSFMLIAVILVFWFLHKESRCLKLS